MLDTEEREHKSKAKLPAEQAEPNVITSVTPHRPIQVPPNRPTVQLLNVKYEHRFHPYSKIMPLMTESPFDHLVDSLASDGQMEPIVEHEGKILEGRHRFLGMMWLGMEPKTQQLAAGIDAFTYVCAKNGQRRELTAAQRAAVAVHIKLHLAKLARERQRQAGGKHNKDPLPNGSSVSDQDGRHERESTTAAAKMAGAGIEATQKITKIYFEAVDVFEAVVAGKIGTVADAERLAALDLATRAKAISRGVMPKSPPKRPSAPNVQATTSLPQPPTLSPQPSNPPAPLSNPLVSAQDKNPDASSEEKDKSADTPNPPVDPVVELVRQYLALSDEAQQRFLRAIGVVTPKAEVPQNGASNAESVHTEKETHASDERFDPAECGKNPANEGGDTRKDLARLIARKVTTGIAVARQLGVDKTAISHFLNGRDGIGKEKQAALVAIIERLSE